MIRMNSKRSTCPSCVCCGIQIKYPITQTMSHPISISSWSRACAETVVNTLKLDPVFLSTLETGVYCYTCLENVREIDYLIRTIDKLQQRLSHFRKKLTAAFEGKNDSGTGDSAMEEKEDRCFSHDGGVDDGTLDSFSIHLPSPITLKLEKGDDNDFMDLSEGNLNNSAVHASSSGGNSELDEDEKEDGRDSDSANWIPPTPLCPSSLRQKLISKRKRMKTIRTRGRPPAPKLNCTFDGCDFLYSEKKEKSYQVHLRKVHREKEVNGESPKPVPEGKICGPCIKEGCVLDPRSRQALREEFESKNYKGQNEFLSECVSIEEPKQRVVINSTRVHTFKYFVPHADSRKSVCLLTLLNIFGISRGRMRKLKERVEQGKGFGDLRGKHKNRIQACKEFSHPSNFQPDGAQHFPCLHCSHQFSLKCCLKRHVRENHKAPVVRADRPKCVECGFLFPVGKEDEMDPHSELHRQRETECRKFSCVLPNCSKFFVNSIDLKKHVIANHEVEGLPRCQFCNAAFKGARGLKLHLKEFHYEVTPFKCTTCKFKATSQPDLDVHKLTHSRISYACSACGLSFKTQPTYKAHMITHHKPRETWPYLCTFNGCGKRFVKGQQLKAHEESHQEVKTYMCEKCPKAYRTYNVMRRHMTLKHN